MLSLFGSLLSSHTSYVVEIASNAFEDNFARTASCPDGTILQFTVNDRMHYLYCIYHATVASHVLLLSRTAYLNLFPSKRPPSSTTIKTEVVERIERCKRVQISADSSSLAHRYASQIQEGLLEQCRLVYPGCHLSYYIDGKMITFTVDGTESGRAEMLVVDTEVIVDLRNKTVQGMPMRCMPIQGDEGVLLGEKRPSILVRMIKTDSVDWSPFNARLRFTLPPAFHRSELVLNAQVTDDNHIMVPNWVFAVLGLNVGSLVEVQCLPDTPMLSIAKAKKIRMSVFGLFPESFADNIVSPSCILEGTTLLEVVEPAEQDTLFVVSKEAESEVVRHPAIPSAEMPRWHGSQELIDKLRDWVDAFLATAATRESGRKSDFRCRGIILMGSAGSGKTALLGAAFADRRNTYWLRCKRFEGPESLRLVDTIIGIPPQSVLVIDSLDSLLGLTHSTKELSEQDRGTLEKLEYRLVLHLEYLARHQVITVCSSSSPISEELSSLLPYRLEMKKPDRGERLVV